MASTRAGDYGPHLLHRAVPATMHATTAQSARKDTIQALWLAVPLFYACFFNQFRPLGAIPLLVAAGSLSAFGLAFGQRYMRPALFVFAAWRLSTSSFPMRGYWVAELPYSIAVRPYHSKAPTLFSFRSRYRPLLSIIRRYMSEAGHFFH